MKRSVQRTLRPRGRRVPAAYPSTYERVVTLHDGRLAHLRPIVPDDRDDLMHAVQEADEDTIRTRFLGGRPPSTTEEFERLVRVDYDRRFAVVALSPDGVGVGIARYEAEPSGERAEVAVAVDPGWRRVGLATAMVHLLGEAAIEHGIRRLTSEFLVENVDVVSLVKEVPAPVVMTTSHGVADAEIDLTKAAEGLGLLPRRP